LAGGVAQTRWMAERVRVREVSNEEGNRLLRIVRRSSGSVVTWRRAQMVLLSAQGMDVPAIAKVAFTSEDRVRAVIHNFNADGFESLYPRYAGGRPPTFTLPQRREIKKIALSPPRGPRPAVFDVEPVEVGGVPGRRGGGRRHQPRGPAGAAPRGGRVVSSPQAVEGEQRPGLRSQEEPDPRGSAQMRLTSLLEIPAARPRAATRSSTLRVDTPCT
jgi:hypothetical protein